MSLPTSVDPGNAILSTRLPRDSGRRRPRPRRVREVGLIWTDRLRAEGRRVGENADSTASRVLPTFANGPGAWKSTSGRLGDRYAEIEPPRRRDTFLPRPRVGEPVHRVADFDGAEAKNGHPPCADTLPVLRWDVRAAHEGEHGTRAGAHSPAYPVDGFESRRTTSRSPRCGLQCDPFAAIPTTNPTCPSFMQITPFKQIVRRSRRSDISENR